MNMLKLKIVPKVCLKGAGFLWQLYSCHSLKAPGRGQSPAVLPYFLSSSDWYLLPMQSTSLVKRVWPVWPVPTYHYHITTYNNTTSTYMYILSLLK